jgi:isopentenyl phosphate kinase
MMTAQDFIANGYKVSLQIQQGEIDRAVADVTAAYVDKVTTDNTTATAEAAIMQLAFILLCQRNTFATRAGGKMKLSPQLSDNAQARQTDYDNADRLLRQLQAATGGIAGKIDKMVDDICMVYMRSYLSM